MVVELVEIHAEEIEYRLMMGFPCKDTMGKSPKFVKVFFSVIPNQVRDKLAELVILFLHQY